MKSPVVLPGKKQAESPAEIPPAAGKSGEGAGSALEQMRQQERARVPRGTLEPDQDPSTD